MKLIKISIVLVFGITAGLLGVLIGGVFKNDTTKPVINASGNSYHQSYIEHAFQFFDVAKEYQEEGDTKNYNKWQDAGMNMLEKALK